MKKNFIIVDCETTIKDTVADFAAVVCDRAGNIINQMAILIPAELDKGLFFIPDGGFWSRENATKKETAYREMVLNGSRMFGTVPAINRWLARAALEYRPILTAYNLQFDTSRCAGTGIDLTVFDNRQFCLWRAANAMLIRGKNGNLTRNFVAFCLQQYTMTAKFNLRSNAESVAHYVTGTATVEPHTALEDILLCELPILRAILKQKKPIVERAYNWREFQLRDLARPN